MKLFELLAVVLVGHGLVSFTTYESREKIHYDNVEKTTIAAFKENSKTHKDFTDIYLACSGGVGNVLDKQCVNSASIALSKEKNISEVVKEFYSLEIPSFLEQGEILDPYKVYPFLFQSYGE